MNAEQVDIAYSDASILVDPTGEKTEAIFILDGKFAAVGSNRMSSRLRVHQSRTSRWLGRP